MQWLIEKQVSNIHFLSIDTGFAEPAWSTRLSSCADYAASHQVTVHFVRSKINFSDLVISRNQFPSPKFQWCASFLKGLTLLSKLDELDPDCTATLVFGKRRLDARRLKELPEFEVDQDFYEGRTLWHPLYLLENEEFFELIRRTGFQVLPHLSRECSPCIHQKKEELNLLSPDSTHRLEHLENQVKDYLFGEPILEARKCGVSGSDEKIPNLERFAQGCAQIWGCGE